MHTGAGNNKCRAERGKPVCQLTVFAALLKFADIRLKSGIRGIYSVDQRNRYHLHTHPSTPGLAGQLPLLGRYENTVEVGRQLPGEEQQQLLCTRDTVCIGNVGKEDNCSFVGHGVSALPGKRPRATIHLLQSFTKLRLRSTSSQ
ncbi:hypothetical protein D3C73_1326110 [compost metagenome]